MSDTSTAGAEVAVRRWRAREKAAFALIPIMEREGLEELGMIAPGELAQAAIAAYEAAMSDPLPDGWRRYAVPISSEDGVWRVPGVMRGAPCISGTRIPTRAIWSFFRAGYLPAEIVQEYPTLTIQEIEVAIRFERARRMARWKAPNA